MQQVSSAMHGFASWSLNPGTTRGFKGPPQNKNPQKALELRGISNLQKKTTLSLAPFHGTQAKCGATLGRGRGAVGSWPASGPKMAVSLVSSYFWPSAISTRAENYHCLSPWRWTAACTSVMPTALRWSTCQVTVASSQKRMSSTVRGRNGTTGAISSTLG